MSTSPIVEAVNDIGRAFESFKKSQDTRLVEMQDRLEQIEAGKDRPKGTGAAPRIVHPYREIVTAGGEKAFEVSAKQRFSDVPDLAAKSEVSLARVLGALALGKNCGDPEALEYANEMKATSTGTSGITLQNSVAAELDRHGPGAGGGLPGRVRGPSRCRRRAMSYIHQTSDPTADLAFGEGISLTATDPGFAARTLTAKTHRRADADQSGGAQDIADAGESDRAGAGGCDCCGD
jgi:hypothetical protein